MNENITDTKCNEDDVKFLYSTNAERIRQKNETS